MHRGNVRNRESHHQAGQGKDGRLSASEPLTRLRYDWPTEMRNDQDVGIERRPADSVTAGRAMRLRDSSRGHRRRSAVQEAHLPIRSSIKWNTENPIESLAAGYETVRALSGLLKCPRGKRRGQEAKATGRKTSGKHNAVDRAHARRESVLT